MQRFKAGDPILILPRFSHLYKSSDGTVTNFRANAFRPMFNEYTVQLADGSTESLFEFQIIENPPQYQNLSATPAYTAIDHIILHAKKFDVELKISVAKSQSSINGQVRDRTTGQFIADAEVTLMQNSDPIDVTRTDAQGNFRFVRMPVGPLNVQIVDPTKSWRILGAFSISP